MAAVDDLPVFWVAPSTDQVMIGFEEAEFSANGFGKFKRGSMPVAQFPNGGRIMYRPVDEERFTKARSSRRGRGAYLLVMDEFTYINRRTYYEILRPMLIDTGGILWAVGTPNGANWAAAEWERALTREDSTAWRIPTVGAEVTDDGLVRKPHPLENPYIPYSEIVAAFEDTDEQTFRQEYLAEIVQETGTVFRKVRDAATAEWQEHAVEGHDYVFGVDWGKHRDWTVITVGDVTTRKVVHVDRFNRIGYDVQAGRLRALYNRFRPFVVKAERNSMGEPNIDALGAGDKENPPIPIEGFWTSEKSKKRIIDNLALDFEKGDIEIVPHEPMIAELRAYTSARRATGSTWYGHPPDGHDDIVMSLAIMWDEVKAGGLFVA